LDTIFFLCVIFLVATTFLVFLPVLRNLVGHDDVDVAVITESLAGSYHPHPAKPYSTRAVATGIGNGSI
jgi:hypothetical protein